MSSSKLSPGMIFTLTGPLARTDAHRTAAVANSAISPTNCPSDLIATKYSLGPFDRVVAKSCAFEAPCTTHDHDQALATVMPPL